MFNEAPTRRETAKGIMHFLMGYTGKSARTECVNSLVRPVIKALEEDSEKTTPAFFVSTDRGRFFEALAASSPLQQMEYREQIQSAVSAVLRRLEDRVVFNLSVQHDMMGHVTGLGLEVERF